MSWRTGLEIAALALVLVVGWETGQTTRAVAVAQWRMEQGHEDVRVVVSAMQENLRECRAQTEHVRARQRILEQALVREGVVSLASLSRPPPPVVATQGGPVLPRLATPNPEEERAAAQKQARVLPAW